MSTLGSLITTNCGNQITHFTSTKNSDVLVEHHTPLKQTIEDIYGPYGSDCVEQALAEKPDSELPDMTV